MQAQVINQNKPAYLYRYRHPRKSFNEVLSNTEMGSDYDECLYNLLESFQLNGNYVVYNYAAQEHFEYFLQNPREYLDL